MVLETEREFFEEHRAEWVRHYRGKFALVRGRELVGAFDTNDSAFHAGVQRWGNAPFLIKVILEEDPIEQIPSLAYGLLNAHPASSV